MQETWFNSWVRKICWRRDRLPAPVLVGFPCGSAGKEYTRNAGDLGSIPGWGRSPGEGKGYPLQYSGMENSMHYIVHGVTKSWTPLSDFHVTALHGWPAPQKHDSTSFGGHGGFRPLLPGSPSRSFRWLCIFLSSPTVGATLCSSPAPAGGLRVDTGLWVLGSGLPRAKPHYWRNLGTGREISAWGRPRDRWGTFWAMASRSTFTEIGVTLPVDSARWSMCSPKPQLPTSRHPQCTWFTYLHETTGRVGGDKCRNEKVERQGLHKMWGLKIVWIKFKQLLVVWTTKVVVSQAVSKLGLSTLK